MKLTPKDQTTGPTYPSKANARRCAKFLKQAAVVAALLALPALTTGCPVRLMGVVVDPRCEQPETIDANGTVEKTVPPG